MINLSNNAMHLSRLRKCLFDSADSMRPGDGERCFDRDSTVVGGA